MEVPELWRSERIRGKELSCKVLRGIVKPNTESLDIPYCTVTNNWTNQSVLEEVLNHKGTNLKHIGIAGYDGNDTLMAILVSKSTNLTVLDMSKASAKVVSTFIDGLPRDNNIRALNISDVGNHNPDVIWEVSLQLSTVKDIVDKCNKLTTLILFGTSLCRDTLVFLCNHLTPSLLRLNLSGERVINADIISLVQQYPHLRYLNLAGTAITIDELTDMIIAWCESMIHLALPQSIGVILGLEETRPDQTNLSRFKTKID